MKKTTIIVKGTDTYETNILINNTAYVKNGEGFTGLLNVRKNRLLGEMRHYYTIYDERKKFYIQTWADDKEGATNDKKIPSYIRVYDAQNEEMLVDDCELIKSFKQYHEVFLSKSKKENKLRLFDKFGCRDSNSIFNEEIDGATHILDRYNDSYFILIRDGKKALYFSNCYDKKPKLITDFLYDDITLSNQVFILTRNGKKHFRFIGDEDNKSIEFDELIIEEKNKNIAYGYKGGKVFVYNLKTKELILEVEADKVSYLGKDGDYEDYEGEYYFSVEKKDKFGLLSSKVGKNQERQRTINQTTILEAEYDEISRGEYSNAFYLKQKGRTGLLVGNGENHQFIKPAYDDITNLKENCFALINNEMSTIVRIYYNPPKTLVENVSEYASVNDGYIYVKDGKKGMLIFDRQQGIIIIDANYDEINPNAEFYYIVKQNKKQGIISRGKILIPVDYDEIKMGGECPEYKSLKDAKKIYFALRKNGGYELAKIDNYQYVECEPEFVSNHTFDSIDFYRNIMVLKDSQFTYIYSYGEKLLKTLPRNSEIREIEKQTSNCSKKYVYYVNGKYYYYKDGKFNEEYNEEKDTFVTTYETDTDVYEVRTTSQKEHDLFCQMIDEMTESAAEETLEQYSKDKQKVKTKYPNINLEKKQKN